MVASKCDPLSELDQALEISTLACSVKYPVRGIAPISRNTESKMSTSFETATAAVSQEESSTESRIPDISTTATGDARRVGPSPSTTSVPQTASDSRTQGKERPAYLIKWSRFEEQLSNAFSELFCSEHFADVTLACDGGDVLKAHKIILAMSSPFFRRIFIDTPCKHPIVVLKEFSSRVMRNIIQYLYMGKVVLNENEINSFMDAADFFGICGVIPDHYSCDIFATTIPDQDSQRHSELTDTNRKHSEGSSRSENEESNEPRDSQYSDEQSIVSQSNVIKYHGIKARWTRRYSNNSFPGGPRVPTSTTVKEHKRSASAGEVESVPRPMDHFSDIGNHPKIPRLTEECMGQPLSDMEMSSTGEEERFEDRVERSARGVGEEDIENRQRSIIQRAYPKGYTSSTIANAEDSSDAPFEGWKNQGHYSSTYVPPNVPTSTIHRAVRPIPYTLGPKDFSHPLQVSVDNPKQPPSFGTSSPSSGVLDPIKSKSHSGYTLYTSPHCIQTHSVRASAMSEPETEYPSTSSGMPLATSFRSSELLNDNRSSMRFRQLSSGGSSTTTSPTAYRQEYHPRPHFSLLSAQNWSFQDAHAHRRNLDELGRENNDRRFRSESLDRSLGPFTNPNHLRGIGTKPHSFPTATDLTMPVSQQFALGLIPQLRSPSSSGSSCSTRPKTKAIRSSQVPQSSRYTAAEVDQMVDAVANYPGNIVPCSLCQKFVKRERLRAHIHECHLLTGEKIICPHCGIALKSKGSFRVHIWRHKRGALPTRSTMSDFDGGRPPSPSQTSGPASH